MDEKLIGDRKRGEAGRSGSPINRRRSQARRSRAQRVADH
jgi:hypothetical protein